MTVNRTATPREKVHDDSNDARDVRIENVSRKTIFGHEPGATGTVHVTPGQLDALIKAGLVEVIAEHTEDSPEPEVDESSSADEVFVYDVQDVQVDTEKE